MSASPAGAKHSIGGGSRSQAHRGAATASPPSASSRNEAPVRAGEFAVIALETAVTNDPPYVLDVLGEVAPNGQAIGLRIQRSAEGPVDLCLRIEDVQHLIGVLLALSCE